MRISTKHIAAALLAIVASAALTVQAQSTDNARFLSLAPPGGLPVIPVMEGWTLNPDGTVSYSFGIINRNDEAVDIPLGEGNYMDPAKFDGNQATHFPAGRTVGAFTVTVAESERDIDVWWYLKTGESEPLKVPGRYGSSAYELDFILPRPQGAMQPMVGIGESGTQRAGLYAQVGDYPRNPAQVGIPLELVVNITDPAERDTDDPRFEEAVPLGVEFEKHQGPGNVEFTRHPETVVPENPYAEDDPRFRFFREPAANQMQIDGPSGLGRVFATFSAPGEYLIRTKVDVHRAPDSSDGDQCCWSNIFQRVIVE
ncbi:MAG: hypothetical protein GKR91_08185 [Pseudomonadales bacterium]|nr:hypothetical protein [Pseudomonadales bacterium]